MTTLRLALGAALLAVVVLPAAAADDEQAFPRFADDRGDRGRTVWLGTCRACHGEGFADAPAVGDRAAWAPRVAKGKPVLYEHALKGFFGPASQMMPPRGGNPALSDEEVRLAVDYMVRLVTR
ncbi:MAG: cytochrome c5 family protein [Piscinibacter sp.]|nr:cytochrome c5 family protein [Piscinibacter sp.]